MNHQNNESSAHLKYLTPKQLEILRYNLFAKAAETMGQRITELKEGENSQGRAEAIKAIQEEWSYR